MEEKAADAVEVATKANEEREEIEKAAQGDLKSEYHDYYNNKIDELLSIFNYD